MRDLNSFLPSEEQEKLTEFFQVMQSKSSSSSDNTPSPKPKSTAPSLGFMLKLPVGRNRKAKKLATVTCATTGENLLKFVWLALSLLKLHCLLAHPTKKKKDKAISHLHVVVCVWVCVCVC